MLADPEEAIAKAKREMKEAHAAQAAEDMKMYNAKEVQRHKKESLHKKALAKEAQRLDDIRAHQADQLKEKSKALIPAEMAGPLEPLRHYPS